MSESVSLWEIDKGIEDAVQEAIDTGSDEALVVLNAYLDGMRDKVDRIAGYIEDRENVMEVIDKEVKRLEDRKRSIKNGVERTKEYVKSFLEAKQQKRLEGRLRTLVVGGCPASVAIDDETLIPAKFIDVKTQNVPRKDDIKRALRAGEEVPGCRLINDKTTLRVK